MHDCCPPWIGVVNFPPTSEIPERLPSWKTSSLFICAHICLCLVCLPKGRALYTLKGQAYPSVWASGVHIHNPLLHGVTTVAWNQPCWECLHDGNWCTLQTVVFYCPQSQSVADQRWYIPTAATQNSLFYILCNELRSGCGYSWTGIYVYY